MIPKTPIAAGFFVVLVSIAIQLPAAARSGNARSVDDAPLLRADISFAVRDYQPLVHHTGPINWIARNPRDGSEVFASSITAGLWKSTDGGSTWSPVRTLPPWSVSAVAYLFDGTPGGAILVTTKEDFRRESGAGVWRSNDHGESWRQVAQVPASPDCPDLPRAHGIAVNGRAIYVATSCGILQSLDGRRFGEVPSRAFQEAISVPAGKYFYSVEVTQSGHVLFGGQAGFFFQFRPASAPAGSVVSGTGGELRRAFAVTPSRRSPDFALALSGVSPSQTMLISKDDGRTWVPVSSAPPGVRGAGGSPFVRILPSATSPTDMFVYCSDNLNIWRAGPFLDGDLSELATNSSYAWTQVPLSHGDPHDIDFYVPPGTPPGSDSLKLLLASDGGLGTCGLSTAVPTCSDDRMLGSETGLSPIQVMKVNGQIIGVGEPAVRRLYFNTWHDDKWILRFEGRPWQRVAGEGATLDMERRVATLADVQIVADYFNTQHNLYGDFMTGESIIVDTTGVTSPPVMVERGIFLEIGATDLTTTLYATPNLTARGISRPAWTRIANLQTCAPPGCVPLATSDYAPLFAGYLLPGKTDAVVYQPYSRGLAMVLGFLDRAGDVRRLRSVVPIYPDMRWRVSHDVLQGINYTPIAGVEKTAVIGADPLNPIHLLIPDITNNKVMQSLNGGETWTPIDDLSDAVTRDANSVTTFSFDIGRVYGPQSLVSSISFFPEHPNLVILGTVENGLFFSQDGALTWQRIPNSQHITNVASFYWRSANSVIVGSWGRGLFEITMRYRLPRPVLDSICSGCIFVPAGPGFASFNTAQIVPTFADLSPAQQRFDEAVLVLNGSINGVEVSDGRLRKVSVTVGSSEYEFGGRNSTLGFVTEEHTGFLGYKGLPVADETRNRGQVVKGLAFTNGRVSHVIYGSEQTPMPVPPTPGPVTLPKSTDPHLKDPYLRIFGPNMMLGTTVGEQPFNLQGFLFKPNSMVELRVDGQVRSQLRADANGRFATRLVAPTYLGPHEIVARQSVGNRTIRAAIGFGVKNSDERRK
jgi:hypothetical protein